MFPQIYAGEQDPERMKARVSQENQNIRKRLGRLTKSMGWEVAPSGTWSRHSFATNLSHAGGVPKELKLGSQYDIMEELKDLSVDELKSLIAMIKKR